MDRIALTVVKLVLQASRFPSEQRLVMGFGWFVVPVDRTGQAYGPHANVMTIQKNRRAPQMSTDQAQTSRFCVSRVLKRKFVAFVSDMPTTTELPSRLWCPNKTKIGHTNRASSKTSVTQRGRARQNLAVLPTWLGRSTTSEPAWEGKGNKAKPTRNNSTKV